MSLNIVTGAGGFLGRALFEHLRETGRDVIGIDREAGLGSADGMHSFDIRDRPKLEAICPRGSKIFHFAAKASVEHSLIDPAATLTDTMASLFSALEVARATSSTLIYPSTAAVFARTNAMPLTEHSHIGPTSPYSASKLAGEAYCMAYRESYGLDVRIVRLFSIYGPQMRRFFIYDAIRKIAAARDRVTFLGTGLQVRDYLHTDDFVAGVGLISGEAVRADDFNLCSSIPISLRELARDIQTCMGREELDIRFEGVEQRFQNDVFYGQNSKVRKLGFAPKIDIKTGLRGCIEAIRRHANAHD